jgi:hypothetical protein
VGQLADFEREIFGDLRGAVLGCWVGWFRHIRRTCLPAGVAILDRLSVRQATHN